MYQVPSFLWLGLRGVELLSKVAQLVNLLFVAEARGYLNESEDPCGRRGDS